MEAIIKYISPVKDCCALPGHVSQFFQIHNNLRPAFTNFEVVKK